MSKTEWFTIPETYPPVSVSVFIDNGFLGVTWLEVELLDGSPRRAIWNGQYFEIEIPNQFPGQLLKDQIRRWKEKE